MFILVSVYCVCLFDLYFTHLCVYVLVGVVCMCI